MKSEANISNQKFHALNGVNDIPRSEIESIVDLAKQENNAEVIYRLSKVLRNNPDAETFSMTIAKYPATGLNGAQHTGDYKEALDDCGRLRPGYRFMGGKVVKVVPKNLKSILRLFFKNKEQFDIQLKSENITISKTYSNIYKFTHWQNGFQNLSEEIKFKENNFNDFYAKFEALHNEVKTKNLKKQPTKVAKIEKGKSPIDAVIEVGKKAKIKNTLPEIELNPKFKIGDSVQISDFGTEAKILNFRVNRKKEIVYKCKYVAPINEIFEAKESELQLFKEWKPAPPKAEPKNKNTDKNPVPFANKPKSISVATAITDVLSLAKYKGTVKPLVANLLYKLFKTDVNAEITPDSDFEKALLQKDSAFHSSFYGEDVYLSSLGIDFVNAVSGRLESLRNQKHNYAMFDGLAGAEKIEFDEKNVQRLIAINLQVDLAQNKLSEYIKSQGFSSMVNVPEKIRNTSEFKKLNKEFQKENEASKQKAKYLGVSNKISRLQRQADLKEYKKRLHAEIKKQPQLKGIVESLATNLLANSLMAPAANSNPNSLASRMNQRANAKHEYYTVADKEISKFLGNIEKKTKESVAITIAGGQGSMKTRFCFQLMNALAQNYKVGHASIEEHPESALYFDKAKQYCNDKALHNISAPEINSIEDVHKLTRENDVIVIDSFSKLQEMDKNCQLDKDFRKAYDGKLFIIIYQLTSDGKMRGGAKSQFDGDCIAFIEKKPNYTENYVWWDKNRYQSTPELKYNIYSGKIQKEPEPEAPKQKDKPKTETFSFEIV